MGLGEKENCLIAAFWVGGDMSSDTYSTAGPSHRITQVGIKEHWDPRPGWRQGCFVLPTHGPPLLDLIASVGTV